MVNSYLSLYYIYIFLCKWYLLQPWPKIYALKVDNTIISVKLIRWIVIYRVDSALKCLIKQPDSSMSVVCSYLTAPGIASQDIFLVNIFIDSTYL